MKNAIRYISLFLIFSVLFVVPAIVFPFPPSLSQGDVPPLMFFLLLFVDVFTILYLIKRINLTGMKLFAAVILSFWGLQTFMTQIETWYFREAMPAITNEILLKLFLNPLITAVTFIPIAMWMLGKWKQADTPLDHTPELKSRWKAVLALSVAYLFIYYLFGFYVAWQFVEVRTFYSGSPEILGFVDQLQHTLQVYRFLFPFQIVRGFLWILLGLPLLFYSKASYAEKIAACILLYCILPSVQLLIENPFMPAGVRMAHLLEVSTSNGLFGVLVAVVLGRDHK